MRRVTSYRAMPRFVQKEYTTYKICSLSQLRKHHQRPVWTPQQHQPHRNSDIMLRTWDDFVHRGDLETLLDYVHEPQTTAHLPPLSHTICAQTATKTEADVIQYEVWHQRLAHCSETKLRKTQRTCRRHPNVSNTGTTGSGSLSSL